MMTIRFAHPIPALWRLGIFVSGFLLAGAGFVANAMWREIPWAPVLFSVKIVSTVLMAAWLCHRLFRCTAASAAAAVWILLLIYFTGPSPALAVIALALAALGVGSLLVPASEAGGSGVAIVLGLAVLSGILGWLLPFPMHYRAVYSIALLVLIVWRWKEIHAVIGSTGQSWRLAVAAAPAAALSAVMLLGLASTFAWIPTIHNDDLAYHMGMPSQLHDLGHYMMAAASNVWAVSAWSSDVLQSIPHLVSGEDAHGALSIVWVLLEAYFLDRLTARLGFTPAVRWLCIAVYASQPMLAGSLGVMQTENPTTAVLLALAFVIQDREQADRRWLLVAATLVGFLLGLKVSNIMLAGPLGLWLLWRWRTSLPWRALPVGVLCALVVGGSSYVYAYLLTGNPVLPLFNGFFHSEYFGLSNFTNPTWNTGFTWNIVWNLVFHTSKFFEGADGCGGFVLIALLGGLLLGLYGKRTRPLALAAALAFVLPLTQTQYLRYATPAIALLIPAMIAPLNDPVRKNATIMRILLAVLLLANFLFVYTCDWQAKQGVLQQLVTEGAPSVVAKFAPERNAARYIDMVYGARARVLVASQTSCFGAPFGGHALVRCWYDHQLGDESNAADADSSGAKWLKIFDQTGIDLVVLRPDDSSVGLRKAIGERDGTKVYHSGAVEVWQIENLLPGREGPAPARAVVVQFKGLSSRKGQTSLDASVVFHCKPSKTPIIMGWRLERADKVPIGRYGWIRCHSDGQASDRYTVQNPGSPLALTVSAVPAGTADLQLSLASSGLSWRNDLVADRDLAGNLLESVKKWNRARLRMRKASR